MEHLCQCLFIHAGTVHHDHIFLDKLKFTLFDIIYPDADKSFLHSDVVTSRGSQENAACCVMADLISVLDHAERSSRGTTGAHHTVIRCILVCGRYETVILLTERIFVYHRKVLQ